MNIIYMGTPQFAVPCLKNLIDNHNVVGVFTQPDKPSGRGQKLNISPVKEEALKHNIPIFQPNTLRNLQIVEDTKNLNPDLIVVVAYGQILPKEILDLPRYGCINVHASLLPKYRGAGPINWVIINGEIETGITTMLMDTGLDTGPILLKEKVQIGEDETAGDLHDRLMDLGAVVLKDTIRLLETGEIELTPQNHDQSSYAPMLTKDLGKIDWNKSAKQIRDLIRGTIPWPTSYTSYDGQPMKIWRSSIVESDDKNIPGTIVDVKKDSILVATGEGILSVEEIQFSGKKRMSVSRYLVGNNIEPNKILGG